MITYPTNKLQKVLLSGGCEQRNLPSGFTQVEYLQSSGTQYIDTGVKLSDTSNVHIKYQYIEGTISGRIIGDIATGTGTIPNKWVVSCSGTVPTSSVQIGWGPTWEPSGAYGWVAPNYNIVDLSIVNHEATCIINGTTYTYTLLSVSFTTTNNAKLFGAGEAYSNCRIYECSIEGLRNLIPCRRNSDNVLGMYDTISQTFLTNAGTGDFTAGADVVPTPDYPIDIVCNNGVVKVSKNLFDKSTQVNGFYINANGGIAEDESWAYSALTPVSPGTNYVFSGKKTKVVNGTSNRRMHAYDSSGNWLSQVASTQIYGEFVGTYSCTGTTPVNCAYIRISYRKADDTDVQLELGSTATTYMEYGQIYTEGTVETVTDSLDNTASAERLLAVGNYKDTQEMLSGSVTRRVGIKVLDGTENWNTDTYEGYRRFYITNFGKSEFNNVFCTHYNSNISVLAKYNNCYLSSTGTFAIAISADQTFTTVAQFNTYLAQQYANGTPVIVVYPLATPTTEQVTPQPLAGNSVTQTAGSIDNLPIDSSTIAELKKRYIGDMEVKKVYIGDNLIYE